MFSFSNRVDPSRPAATDPAPLHPTVWSTVTVLDLSLDADPRSVGPARAEFRRFAEARVAPVDVDEASVVVSELVTNAQRVSPEARVLLHVSLIGELLRIEVIDGEAAHPSLPSATGVDAENGRGLFLVQSLSRRWGTSEHRLGKCVWAELPVHLLAGSVSAGR